MVSLSPTNQLALIVHDMLNDSLKPGGKSPGAGTVPTTAQVIANHVRLVEAARRYGIAIFYTGHALQPDYRDAAHGANSPTYGGLQAGTWGAQIIDELKPRPEDWIIRKGGGYSAFTGTALDKWLRRLGVSTLIIGGVATQSGVDATVRAARDLDYETMVVSDACQSGDPALHEAALFNFTWNRVATTDEVLDALARL